MSRYDTPEKLEAMRISRRKYDAANREKRNARRSRDAKKRKEVRYASRARWIAANPGKLKEYSAVYCQRHKEKRRAAEKARVAKKRASRETFATRDEARQAIDSRGLAGARPRKVSGRCRYYIQTKAKR